MDVILMGKLAFFFYYFYVKKYVYMFNKNPFSAVTCKPFNLLFGETIKKILLQIGAPENKIYNKNIFKDMTKYNRWSHLQVKSRPYCQSLNCEDLLFFFV